MRGFSKRTTQKKSKIFTVKYLYQYNPTKSKLMTSSKRVGVLQIEVLDSLHATKQARIQWVQTEQTVSECFMVGLLN